MEFIDKHREQFGVEPICQVLGVAASTYHAASTRAPSPRQLRDERLKGEILRVYDDNFQVYGAGKIWRQLRREGHVVAGSLSPATSSYRPPNVRRHRPAPGRSVTGRKGLAAHARFG